MKTSCLPSLRPVAAALASIALLSLTGCASFVGTTPDGLESTGETFRYNGLTLVKMKRTDDSQLSNNLVLRSKSDKDAADGLIKYFNKQAASALSSGDGEAFAVARYISSKLARTRLEQAFASQSFLSSLASNKDGSASIPAGGSVYLPNEVYDSTRPVKSSGKRADADRFIDMMELHASAPVRFTDGVAVADAGSVNGAISAFGALARTVKNERAEQLAKIPSLADLNVGDSFAAKDGAGNRYFLEKTPDGLVLHNPSSGAQLVNLDQLKFMPTIEAPSQLRKDASWIIKNINAAHNEVQQEGVSIGRGLGVWSAAPNVIVYAGGGLRYFIDTQGRKTKIDDPEARNAYKTNAPYRLAVDLTDGRSLRTPQFQEFRGKYCRGSAAQHEFGGDYVNKETLACLDSKGNVTYSKTFLIDNDFKSQSWSSILNDKSLVKELNGIENFSKLAEALVGIIPFAGNVDAGSRCATGTSLSTFLVNNYSSRASRYATLKQYVGDLIPQEESPSDLIASMDCAQAVGGVGSAMRGMTKAARALQVNNTLTSPSYRAAADTLKLFDSDLIQRRSYSEALSLTSDKLNSPTAAYMFKMFYDKMQNMNNLSDVAKAITGYIS